MSTHNVLFYNFSVVCIYYLIPTHIYTHNFLTNDRKINNVTHFAHHKIAETGENKY